MPASAHGIQARAQGDEVGEVGAPPILRRAMQTSVSIGPLMSVNIREDSADADFRSAPSG